MSKPPRVGVLESDLVAACGAWAKEIRQERQPGQKLPTNFLFRAPAVDRDGNLTGRELQVRVDIVANAGGADVVAVRPAAAAEEALPAPEAAP